MDAAKIAERIVKLKTELFDLNREHDLAVKEHQRAVGEYQRKSSAAQARFDQINGAIAELESLIQSNGEEPPNA